MCCRSWLSIACGLIAACGSDDGQTVPTADAPLAIADADPGMCTLPPMAPGVSTLAGCGEAGAIDGARGVARFHNPVSVLADETGLLYVADFDNGLIRTVDGEGSVRTLVRRTGFSRPFGMTLANGTLFVATDNDDAGNHSSTSGTIWRADPATGDASVIARDIGRPRGLAGLGDGRVIMTDYQHHVVEILDPVSGQLSILAGTFDQPGYGDLQGAAARFDAPVGIAALPDGRFAIADRGNNRVRAIDLAGNVSTIAGTGDAGALDGPASRATFSWPEGIAIDGGGTIYVSDLDNFVIRRIRGGSVDTLVGDHIAGWHDATELGAAELYGLEGVAVSTDGHALWIADGNRGESDPFHRVRVVSLP